MDNPGEAFQVSEENKAIQEWEEMCGYSNRDRKERGEDRGE